MPDLRNITNRQVTSVLRNFPWPIRNRILVQKPVLTHLQGHNIVAVLCEPRHFLEGLWSLWSWMRHLSDYCRPLLLVDGHLTRLREEQFHRLFPGGQVIRISRLFENEAIGDEMRRFVDGHIFGKKLAALNILQKTANVLYSDSDVLALNKPSDIISLIQHRNSNAAYLHDEVGYQMDRYFVNLGASLGVEPSPKFNAGLVWIPKGTIDQELLKACLAGWSKEYNVHFSEQTLFSILMRSAGAIPLPAASNVLSWVGVWCLGGDLDCGFLQTRHYTGPVRHRMYFSAYPWIISQVARDG